MIRIIARWKTYEHENTQNAETESVQDQTGSGPEDCHRQTRATQNGKEKKKIFSFRLVKHDLKCRKAGFLIFPEDRLLLW